MVRDHKRFTLIDHTITVGSGQDFATIQGAIDWVKGNSLQGLVKISVDAGTYAEALDLEDLNVLDGATLEIEGDTRVLAGLAYVDGMDANTGGLTNGGSGVVTLSNAGSVITVTCATTNPDFDADSWGNGDGLLVYDNTGTLTEYTISSTLNNAITLTVAAPNVGNDGTFIILLPDRRIEPSSGVGITIKRTRGLTIDGFYVAPPSGQRALYGYIVASMQLENVVLHGNGADCLFVTSLCSVGANTGAFTCVEGTIGVRSVYNCVLRIEHTALLNQSTNALRARYGDQIAATEVKTANCAAGFQAQYMAHVYLASAWARQTTGIAYYAGQRGYIYAPSTNANNNGNGTDYSPAVSDTFGNNNGSITWS